MDKIAERLSLLIKINFDNSQTRFSELIGIKQNIINNWVRGKNLPSYEGIYAISKSINKLNLEWLILGKGLMMKDQTVYPLVEENISTHNLCQECLKKEGIIETLKDQLQLKERKIEILNREIGGSAPSKKAQVG